MIDEADKGTSLEASEFTLFDERAGARRKVTPRRTDRKREHRGEGCVRVRAPGLWLTSGNPKQTTSLIAEPFSTGQGTRKRVVAEYESE